MDTLLPCPFCGSDELGLNRPSERRTGPHWHDWFIRCYRCHVETAEYPTEPEAIAAWNTRTPSGLSLPESDSADHLGVVIGRKAQS